MTELPKFDELPFRVLPLLDPQVLQKSSADLSDQYEVAVELGFCKRDITESVSITAFTLVSAVADKEGSVEDRSVWMCRLYLDFKDANEDYAELMENLESRKEELLTHAVQNL